VLIKEFYRKELTKEDIKTITRFLDYQDVLFYVESKTKREKASYTTRTSFEPKEVESLRLKAVLFLDKAKQILELN